MTNTLDALAYKLRDLKIDDELIPILCPIANWTVSNWDFRQFDADVCRTGCTVFARPISPADQVVPGAPPLDGDCVLVRQLAPGIRCRTGVTLG